MRKPKKFDPAYRKLREADAMIIHRLVEQTRKADAALERAKFALELVTTAHYQDGKLDVTFEKLWPSRVTIVKDAIAAINALNENGAAP
jgi:hypothetical protein